MLPGLLLDERVITGAPAWLKPASLRSQLQCIRSLLYGCWACSNNIGELVWLQMPRLLISCANNSHHSPGSTGTTSHFNFSTPQDEAQIYGNCAYPALGSNFGYGNFTAARAVG